MRRPLLALSLLPWFAAGCFYAESVNGEEHHFAFVGPHGVVAGEAATLTIAKSADGLIACPPKQCVSVGGDTPRLVELLDAFCDDDACVIDNLTTANAAAVIALHGAKAVTTRLHVRARLSNGTIETDRWRLDLAAPSEVSAICSNARCAGHDAVFAGSTIDWRVQAQAHGADGSLIRLQTANLGATVDDEAIVSVLSLVASASEPPPYTAPNPVITADENDNPLFPSWKLRLQAHAPGVTQVRLRVGAVTRTVTVRVAAPEEVTDAELRGIYEPGLFHDNIGRWVDVDSDATLDPSLELSRGHSRTWTVRLRLADGTFAVGGASVLRASGVLGHGTLGNSEVQDDADDASPLAAPTAAFFAGKSGQGTLTFDLGTVHRAWSINVGK